MTAEQVLSMTSNLLSYPLGKAIAGNDRWLFGDEAKLAIEGSIIQKEGRSVVCPEDGIVCKVKRESESLVAYHAEGGFHHFPVKETDTFQYVVNHVALVEIFMREGLNLSVETAALGSRLVYGRAAHGEQRFLVILVPKLIEGSLGALYEFLAGKTEVRTTLVVTFDSIGERGYTSIMAVSRGFATLCRASDLLNEPFRRATLQGCFFRGKVERIYVGLRKRAFQEMEFGLEPEEYSDQTEVIRRLLSAQHSADWDAFEKLTRYVLAGVFPSALKGFGRGAVGRIPDTVGILPDENSEPDRFVIFDAKALISLTKSQFLFNQSSDPIKYAGYVKTANKMAKKVKIGDITLLFVAPDFSVDNLVTFSNEFQKAVSELSSPRQVGLVFMKLEALVVLFLTQSDQAHSVVMRSKDPSWEFLRLLFSPDGLTEYCAGKGILREREVELGKHRAVVIDSDLLQSVLNEFYGKDEQFGHYFNVYAELAKRERRGGS